MLATIGQAYDYKGGIVIKTSRPPADNLSDSVTVLWQDSRQISPDQRRKAWALVGEIAAWAGYMTAADKDMLNQNMKIKFLCERADELTAEAIKRFSLSDVDMTTARMYITFLVDFCIENGVPTKEPLWELADDIEAYIYHCSINKLCCVCRREADGHHCERVGMGRDRKAIIHEGMQVMPLCRHHHMECHTMSQEEFNAKYHLVSIAATKDICKKWGLKYVCD